MGFHSHTSGSYCAFDLSLSAPGSSLSWFCTSPASPDNLLTLASSFGNAFQFSSPRTLYSSCPQLPYPRGLQNLRLGKPPALCASYRETGVMTRAGSQAGPRLSHGRGLARTKPWAWPEGKGGSRARGIEDLGRDPDSPGEAWSNGHT